MAWVRWSIDSDVYVYDHVGGGIVCCSCLLTLRTEHTSSFGKDIRVETYPEMIEHLREHVRAGHRVPLNLDDLNERGRPKYIGEK